MSSTPLDEKWKCWTGPKLFCYPLVCCWNLIFLISNSRNLFEIWTYWMAFLMYLWLQWWRIIKADPKTPIRALDWGGDGGMSSFVRNLIDDPLKRETLTDSDMLKVREKLLVIMSREFMIWETSLSSSLYIFSIGILKYHLKPSLRSLGEYVFVIIYRFWENKYIMDHVTHTANHKKLSRISMSVRSTTYS